MVSQQHGFSTTWFFNNMVFQQHGFSTTWFFNNMVFQQHGWDLKTYVGQPATA
jgi:hypothetical protein